jgi:ankyrin repeat protein
VNAIDESEGLTPTEVDQMRGELQLLQGRVVANIEKKLQAASDKGKEEGEKALADANELIACINADARRLHGDSAKVVGSAEALLGPCLLVDAAYEGDAKMVRELLAAGADVNHTKEGDGERTALFKAAWKGHLEAAQALIDAGADVDKGRTTDGATPLYISALENRLQVAQALIDAGADVDKGDKDGQTPLTIAGYCGHLEIEEALKCATDNKPHVGG